MPPTQASSQTHVRRCASRVLSRPADGGGTRRVCKRWPCVCLSSSSPARVDTRRPVPPHSSTPILWRWSESNSHLEWVCMQILGRPTSQLAQKLTERVYPCFSAPRTGQRPKAYRPPARCPPVLYCLSSPLLLHHQDTACSTSANERFARALYRASARGARASCAPSCGPHARTHIPGRPRAGTITTNHRTTGTGTVVQPLPCSSCPCRPRPLPRTAAALGSA